VNNIQYSTSLMVPGCFVLKWVHIGQLCTGKYCAEIFIFHIVESVNLCMRATLLNNAECLVLGHVRARERSNLRAW
jgi:hypothetical protein